MEEIQPLLNALSAEHGWIAAFVSWMGIFRCASKPVGTQLQVGLSKLIANAPDWAVKLTGNVVYKVFAFLIDWLCSVKLPSQSSVAAIVAKGGNTEEIQKAMQQ